ncbi:zinc-ribbon domain-containing protein [Nitrosarchaeum sp.]|nr:zinc-ribbon domain-containing protein [Nitrosarchaeum sp.]MCV0412812.1 50S ribosomal protein L32 [Nitrosarchaeum sp.]
MKPQSCRNCGKELHQNQRVCPSCGRDTGYDDVE